MFFLLGSFFIFLAWNSKKKAVNSQSWPHVEGKITSFNVVRNVVIPFNVISCSTSYNYTVRSRRYENDKICFGVPDKKKIGVRERKYAEEKTVDVFYDPKNPKNSVLERTYEGIMRFIFYGAGCIMLGILFLSFDV